MVIALDNVHLVHNNPPIFSHGSLCWPTGEKTNQVRLSMPGSEATTLALVMDVGLQFSPRSQ